jgi:hypothetical protein
MTTINTVEALRSRYTNMPEEIEYQTEVFQIAKQQYRKAIAERIDNRTNEAVWACRFSRPGNPVNHESTVWLSGNVADGSASYFRSDKDWLRFCDAFFRGDTVAVKWRTLAEAFAFMSAIEGQ